jgi:acetylornithine deacetylase/succinyl-diaminopimelate desuccinylase-like protein
MFPPMSSLHESEPVATDPLAPARDWLRGNAETIVEDQIEIARCAAPPFNEQKRAELVADRIAALNLRFDFDEVGNLLSYLPTATNGEYLPLIIAAHLDSVFGSDVRIDIRGEGSRWIGPGVSDNARGIAVALAVARSLVHTGARLPFRTVLAFTVGEEGPGDLRGVKHLFRQGSPLNPARAFIAVDGGGLRRIICRALGIRRYRVRVRGPGGHSWTNWGRTNPAAAVGRFMAGIRDLELPDEPRTTLTAARHGGGTSINAIPEESWVELDLRSEAASQLEAVQKRLHEVLEISLAEERRGREGDLTADWELIGERPAARMASDEPLVVACREATRAVGIEPEYAVSSTDANVPMALGIPSIAIGGGGRSGDTHTEHEWFEDTDGAAGALRLLHILSALSHT